MKRNGLEINLTGLIKGCRIFLSDSETMKCLYDGSKEDVPKELLNKVVTAVYYYHGYVAIDLA